MPTLVEVCRDEVMAAFSDSAAMEGNEAHFEALLDKLIRVTRSGGHRYLVKVRGRDVGTFVYARDAQGYIDSDYARRAFDTHDERGIIPLYPVEDFTLEDTVEDRKVVGLTGHGNAILAALDKAGS